MCDFVDDTEKNSRKVKRRINAETVQPPSFESVAFVLAPQRALLDAIPRACEHNSPGHMPAKVCKFSGRAIDKLLLRP
jgi:hypothetical protein